MWSISDSVLGSIHNVSPPHFVIFVHFVWLTLTHFVTLIYFVTRDLSVTRNYFGTFVVLVPAVQ